MPSPPSLPDPTARSGQKLPGEQGQPGDQKESAEQRSGRQKAGADLQKAGEKIAQAGEVIGSDSSQPSSQGDQSSDPAQASGGSDMPPLFPEEPTDNAGSEPPDPLMPESDSQSESQELVFEESQEESATSSDSSDTSASEQSGETSESAAAGSEIAEAGESEPATEGGQQNAEIAAAQDALEKAGEALQKAGEAVSNAESETELAEAEQLLSDARISVILAGQDLNILNDVFGDPNNEDEPFETAEESLEEANILLVIATQAVLNARLGLPEFPEGLPSGGIPTGGIPTTGDDRLGTLDDELDQSLVIFDGQIQDARGTIVDSTPPPITGSSDRQRTGTGSEDLMEVPQDILQTGQTGNVLSKDIPGEEQIASAAPPPDPEDIPSAQGDDIVAQQLREAAIAETDPELKEKLWEEYRRYKAGL